MIITDREKKICEKHSKADADGKVHCSECPLTKGEPQRYDFRCKANSHYNRTTREWEYDSVEGGENGSMGNL